MSKLSVPHGQSCSVRVAALTACAGNKNSVSVIAANTYLTDTSISVNATAATLVAVKAVPKVSFLSLFERTW